MSVIWKHHATRATTIARKSSPRSVLAFGAVSLSMMTMACSQPLSDHDAAVSDHDAAIRCADALRSAYPLATDLYVNVGLYADPALGEGTVALPDGSGVDVALSLDTSSGRRTCVLSTAATIDNFSLVEQVRTGSFLVHVHVPAEGP